MSRKYLYAILACLLSLLPVSSFAQSLTKCEYWFDDNFDKRKPIKLSGTEDEIDMMINTESLTPGVHEIFFRFLQSDGQYSSISSRRFTKFGLGDSKLLEYWFDGNRNENQPLTGVIPSEDPNAIDFDDLIDCGSLTSGFHTLSYRVVSEDGLTASSIITKSFYKYVGLGDTKLLEYWFDGNREEVHRLPGVTSSEEEDALDFDNMIDCSKLPTGFHTISLRVISQNKLISSSVITKSFFKYVGLGNANILEYWFDDNRKDISRIPGTVSEDGTTIDFLKEVSLNSLTPGHHRIYYRVVSKDGLTNSAINTATIMVRSKYDINPEDVEITHMSIAVDDETPKRFILSETGNVVDIDCPIDFRDLIEGTHQLKLKFENSIGAGVTEIFNFTVKAPETPTITISAEEKNGLVNLKFNSIPNDIGYRIFRVDANGVEEFIKVEKVSHYPNDVFYTDNPSPGITKYYVQGVYSDITGERHIIVSNVVSTSVENVQREYGYIEGEIYYDGKRKVNYSSDITFSDNGMIVKSNDEGVFRRDKVPVGTELTVSLAQNDKYMSIGTKLKVVKGRNKVRLDAIKRFEFPVNDVLEYGNLVFVGEKKYEPGEYLKFTVKNSTRAVWRGKLCVKVIAQSCDKDEELSIGFNDSQVLPGSVAPFSFSYLPNYQLFYSDVFELGISKENSTKEVTIPLDGIYNDGPTQMFNFYVKCIKEDGTERLVVPNYNSQTTRNNPLEILLEGGAQNKNKVEFFTNLIIYLCSTVKEVDDITGKASTILGIKENRMKNLYNELTYKIEHAKSDEDLMNDVELQKVIGKMIEDCDKYKLQTQDFRNRIAPIVKETKSFLDLYETIKKSIDAVKDFKEASAKTDCQKAVYLAKKYLSLYDDGFAKILKSYIDITAAIVNKIHYLSWAYNEPQIPMDMFEHHLRLRIKILNKKGNAFNYYTKSAYIIDKVLIKGYNQEKNGAPDVVWASLDDVDTSFSILNPWHDYATFSQVNTNSSTNADDPNGFTSGNEYRFGNLKNEAFKGLWAEIYWYNGRVSYIPLTETDTEGVSYERNAPWSIFTITFKADTTDYSHAADIIHLVE